MDAEETAIFDGLFHDLLIQESKPWRPSPADRFWLAVWRTADVSRSYRAHAAQWRDAGVLDWAADLETAADQLDADWDARMRAFHDAR